MRSLQSRYIIVFFGALLMVVVWNLHRASVHQLQLQEEYLHTKAVAERLQALKEGWSSTSQERANLQRTIKKVLNNSEGVDVIQNGGRLNVSATRIDAKSVERLLNKVLNQGVEITQLHLERINDTSASLKLEIAL